MYKKIVCILVLTLLITTAISAVGIMNEKEISINNSPVTFQPIGQGLDQQQTNQEGSGFLIIPTQWLAQGFKPTVEKLAAVQLYIFKHGSPPAGVKLTASIRDTLNGSDLAVTSVSADQIEDYKWITFNFPEINVTPEEQYYIVCRSDGGSGDNVYCWFYGNNNPYDRGNAWMSVDEGLNWDKFVTGYNYQDPDFCFKTYSKKTRDRTFETNLLFLRFLENHPRIFPILRQLLGLM
jgi:hypothetical protein